MKMRIILVFVSTLDGKVTRWGDPKITAWSSQQDKAYFKKTWNDARLIVMGSNTYRAERLGPSQDHRIVVMTRDPSQFKTLHTPGQLEFTDEEPAQLASRFEKEDYQQMLLVGGANVATSFLKAQLVDEIWLTIEPRIFGTGGNFVTGEKLDVNLRLIHCEKVNEEGTLITKYQVLK
jgi:dihydrofolate reductase